MKACIPITSWSKREENTRFPPVFIWREESGMKIESRKPQIRPAKAGERTCLRQGRCCQIPTALFPLWPARRENRRKRRSTLLLTLCFIRRIMGNMSGQKYRCSGTCPPWILTGRVCIGYGEIIPRRLWQTGTCATQAICGHPWTWRCRAERQ